MSYPNPSSVIRLRGVRHNNLKNFDLDLPLHRLIVVTGLSGSGKSSLAFDTLYAEGQRRYIETFSPYARQFFDRMDKPQVDSIEGIPPAIAIEQRNTVRTTRSTVGTMTEICDYLKVLWPHFAQLHCRQCGRPVRKESPQQIWETLNSEPGTRNPELLISFDVPLSEKLSLEDSLALIAKQGYQRLLLDGQIVRIEDASEKSKIENRKSAITVVQDRLRPTAANRPRFVEACEQAYHFGKGKLAIREVHPPSSILHPRLFSNRLHCATCNLEYHDPSPALFSFNHPLGACPTCKGFGRVINIDYDLAIPDRSLTLADGAVRPWRTGTGAESQADLRKFCKIRRVPMDVPFARLPAHQQKWVIEGDADYGIDDAHTWPRAWYGVKGYFKWLETKSYKMHVRVLLSRYRAYTTCPTCEGARFQPDTLLYLLPVAADVRRLNSNSEPGTRNPELRRLTLADFYALPIRDALGLIDSLAKSRVANHAPRTDPISLALDEIQSRLRYLTDVGLSYLTLDRPTRTLSGGETERVNLTTCLGTRLVNTLFVLDEPSVGLHPRDTDRLVRILQQLRDAGNTVLVVEHEASVMRAADEILDIGPGHGATGGQIVFQGPYNQILKSKDSLTGQYLAGTKQIEIPSRRPVAADVRRLHLNPELGTRNSEPGTRNPELNWLKLEHASAHNLKDLTVSIPLGRLVCITGVSGSGKSTLIRDVLYPGLVSKLQTRITETKASDGSDPKENIAQEEQNDASIENRKSKIQSSFLSGAEHLDRVILVDQSSLGKTPRSNPAVYIGAFDDIRELFAQSEAAKQRGYNASAFSFNSAQGQCERCRGAGFEKIEMQFLSDVFIRCPDCDGRRYRPHILEVKLSSRRREEAVSYDHQSNRIRLYEHTVHSLSSPNGGEGRGLPAEASAEAGEEVDYKLAGAPVTVLQLNDQSCHPSSFDSSPSPACPAEASREGRVGRERAGVRAFPATRHLPPVTSWSIADLLDATVDEAIEFLSTFAESKPARRAVVSLTLLQESGLGYLRLGQPINTLSGGESQRLKLVSHLAEVGRVTPCAPSGRRTGSVIQPGTRNPEPGTGGTLFLFDEPTTGLHFDDIRVLLKVFQRLVDAGHSVVIIEHNLDVIKYADWVIDLGPDAGDQGGQIVAQGTPEDIAACEASHTGGFLKNVFPGKQVTKPGTRPQTFDATRNPEPGTRNPSNAISITGAREHNLKNLSLEIPRGQFVVVTGVSGSGKSTLAFDLLFAEGQRRFLDSMNLYARQFVEQLSRPDVDLITGIPPTVSIEQRNSRGGGKSTVATVTEIFHFLRLLFARLGTQYCPDCHLPVQAQTRDEVGRHLRGELKQRGDLLLLAPIVKGRKGFHSDVAEWAARHGYKEIRADGKMYDTGKPFRLDRFREHNVEIVVGVLEKGRVGTRRRRVAAAQRSPQQLIDEAIKLGNGTVLALDNHGHQSVHSTERACPHCGRSFEPLDPKNFSYNSPSGWCPRCRGFGELFYMPEDVDRGAREDAISESWFEWMEGKREPCPECHGARLNPIARAVRLDVVAADVRRLHPKIENRKSKIANTDAGLTMDTFSTMSVETASKHFGKIKFAGRAGAIARDILPELRERLKFLNEVGLGYLQLGRGVPTLSGGEAQRIRLAAQLGSNLSGVLYVLDEPTIGLHARDNEQLLASLEKLKRRGNSVIVVEHDEETMRRADYVIDLGPGAGIHGGQVVATGTLAELTRHPESITGQCLRAERKFPARGKRRLVSKSKIENRKSKIARLHFNSEPGTRNPELNWLKLEHASINNLKDLTVPFPLGRLVVVTGVSGSGKSTLIRECLLPALQAALKRGSAKNSSRTTHHAPRLTGHESIQSVHEVDQSPIGRTPRSVPSTYVGFFNDIRALFAQVPEARLRGYGPGRFSFNSPQGRCPECQGAGEVKLEMNFLPPAYVRCESCGGSRFNRETLDILYGGKNIAQVLDLSVEEALVFFASLPKIRRPLQALHDTGLNYLKLGQTSPTLSGGEAQRVKLVTHLLSGLKEADLFERQVKRNLFILEEPTIGLHMSDVKRLVEVMQRLVDAGHSVIVIEHNLDLIAEADWVIDLGPEGGDGGGRIVAQGTPEQIARNKKSHTGRFLSKLLPAA